MREMFEDVPDRILRQGIHIPDFRNNYKRDRADIYRSFDIAKHMETMEVRVYYKIESVECCPDYDW